MVPGTQVLQGTNSWSFSMNNASSQTATNASITVQSGYAASRFQGVSSFPVTTSAPALAPGQALSLTLSSDITTAFQPGFDSARAMSPLTIATGGGTQTVHVAFTRTDASACPSNTPGFEGCSYKGDVATGIPGAAIVGFSAPTNLDQSERFNSNVQPDHVDWGMNDPILGKQYVVTVVIALPNQGAPYRYKPIVHLDLGASGAHGCGQDSCVGPTTSVTLPEPTLDGPTPGSGHVTFSVNQPFTWDEGGPIREATVGYSGMMRFADGGNDNSTSGNQS